MTAYELADVVTSYNVQGATYFAMWLTLASAYAIVAYAAGADLTRSQLVWLNTLYIFAATLSIMGVYGSFNSQAHYIQKLLEFESDSPQFMNRTIAITCVVVLSAGTVSTLKFMWDIRHPKSK